MTNATNTRFFSFLRSLRVYTLMILCAVLLSACVQDLTGNEMDERPPDEPEEPEQQFRTVYDLKLTTRFIEVTGSCDKVAGVPTQGEFQYRYEISGGGKSFSLESQNYGSRLGVVIGRVAGQMINFPDETYSWSGMSSPASINVKLFGTEWDTAIRDSRMKNRNGSKTVPFKLGSETRTVTVGATSECQIYLAYTAQWTERKVAI